MRAITSITGSHTPYKVILAIDVIRRMCGSTQPTLASIYPGMNMASVDVGGVSATASRA